jgi:hypothetical protein
MEFRLIAHKRTRAHRQANIWKVQFDRHLLSRGQFSGDNRAHTGLADIGAAPRQIFRNPGSQRNQVHGHVDGMTGKPALWRFEYWRWSCTHQTASAE